MPRINLVSFTFLFAFALGTFAGGALALGAVALSRPADSTTIVEVTAVAAAPSATPSATATQTPTVTPTPMPVVRTLATLQVHIGPASDYAILGTLASGSEIEVQGRDTNGDWVAIQFPPGSTARGWIPAEHVENITLFQILSLDVLQAGLAQLAPSPTPTFTPTNTPTLLEGNDGVPTQTPEVVEAFEVTPTAIPTSTATPSPTVFVTPTPVPNSFGAADLALVNVTTGAGGSIRVSIENLGPFDVPGVSVVVSAEGFDPELLSTGVLRAGQGATFQTSATHLTTTTNVSVTIDPNSLLTDANRSNNTRSYTLTP